MGPHPVTNSTAILCFRFEPYVNLECGAGPEE